MPTIKYISLFVILINLNAQTITFNEDSTAAAIENNRIYFPLMNNGIIADVDDNTIKSIMTYDNKSVLFSGGFFLSGYSDTTLWANGVASSSFIQDYQAGNITTISEDTESIIYAVKASDIPFGEEWQNWKTAVEQGAYYYDGDNNGVYNPVDKNNNGQWDANEDKPDILYDASLFTVFNDEIPAAERRWSSVDPLGIEIRQTVFVSNRNTILDDVVFVRYSIVYKGLGIPSEADSLTEVIFSFWSDADIGFAYDDLSGCDTLLKSGHTFNYESSDADFGVDPPSVFKTIVQGPMVKSNNPNEIGYNRMGPALGEELNYGLKNLGLSSFVVISKYSASNGTPSDKNQARNYMLGLTRFGAYLEPCDENKFWSVKGDIDCSSINPLFWLSGDPVTNYGWINNFPIDQRDLTSTGKFTLRKNEPMDIIVAYTVGRGTDHLNSITVARETVEYIHEEYERNFSTIVGVEEEEREELPSSFILHQNYPNPFNPSTTIKFSIPKVSEVRLSVYNTLGQEVALLLEDTKHPGSYEVAFDGSSLSSGVYIYTLQTSTKRISRKMLLIK